MTPLALEDVEEESGGMEDILQVITDTMLELSQPSSIVTDVTTVTITISSHQHHPNVNFFYIMTSLIHSHSYTISQLHCY